MAAMPMAALAQEGNPSEVPLGLWRATPDARGIVFHVRTRQCGAALCGRVERVKNAKGYDAPSNAVSSLVMRNLRAQPDGSFLGEMRGADGRSYPASRVQARGDTLDIALCKARSACTREVWTRLR